MCDAWLHVYDGGRFWPIVELARVEGKSHVWLLVERLLRSAGAACSTWRTTIRPRTTPR